MSNQYCSWRDGRAAFFGGWVQFKDEWRYLVACGEHVGYLGGPEKTDRLPYRSPEPRARRGQQRGICHVNMSPEMAARLLAEPSVGVPTPEQAP